MSRGRTAKGALVGATFAAAQCTTTLAGAAEGPGDAQALPCRPTIACTAEIVSPGVFELEAGGIYRRLSGGLAQVSTPFLAKLTLVDFLQLQLGGNGYQYEHGAEAASYFDNVSPGLKFHLVGQDALRPAVSVSVAGSFPSAAQAGYVAYDDVLLTAYVTKDFGPVHADLNAGFNRLGVNAGPGSQGWTALALSTGLPAHLGLALEGYYFSPAPPVALHDGGVLAALTYSPKPWLVLDGGADVGFFGARSLSVFVGLTVIPFVLFNPSS